MKSKYQLLDKIGMLTIFFAFIVSIIYFVIFFYPFKPLEVSTPMRVHQKVVNSGDLLFYDISFCKNTEKESTIVRYLKDGYDTYLDTTIGSRQKGCQDVTVSVLIPLETPSGIYSIQTITSYKYTEFRTITVTFETEKFQVINTL